MRVFILPWLLVALCALDVKLDGSCVASTVVRGGEAACLDSSDASALLQGGLRVIRKSLADGKESFERDLNMFQNKLGSMFPPTQQSRLATAPIARSSSCQSSATHGWPLNVTLSSEQLRRGAVNLNGASRLRSLVHKLESGRGGQELHILVVGGSIEEKVHVDSIMSKSGATHVVDFFNMQKHALQMSSVSQFEIDAAWSKMLNSTSKYDLIFIDGAVNFPLKGKPGFASETYNLVKEATVRRSFDERIIRALIEHPNSPAVMLVTWFYRESFFRRSQARVNGTDARAYMSINGLEWEYSTWEDESYTFLATYYEISMVSGRSALLHSSELESISFSSLGPRFKSSDIFQDGLHPSILGHILLSQVVQFAICEQFHLLQSSRSTSDRPSSAIFNVLPPAIFASSAHQLAMHRGAELSGFQTLDEHIKIDATSTNPITVLNTTNESSMLPWELRVTVLPLAFLEGFAFFGVNQAAELTLHAANPGLRTFALEPFRFIGVLHIVLMHELMFRKEEFWWRTAASFGKYWVQFFFALSGLVLYISQGGSLVVSNPGSFVMKRAYAIYPVYVIGIVMALSSMESPGQATWNYLFQHIAPGFLLIDSWASPYGIQNPNGPAWFVCTLFAFWLCFPRWYRFLRAVRSPKLVLLFAYSSTFGLPMLYAVKNMRGQCYPSLCAAWGPFDEFHPFSNWQSFVIGMCIGRMLQDTDPDEVPSGLRNIAATIALLTLLSLPLFSPMPSDSVLTLFMDKGPLLMPVFATFLYFLPLGGDVLLRPIFLEKTIPTYLGSVSGHLFLLHLPVRMLLDRAGGVSIPATILLQLIVTITVYEAQKYFSGPLRSSQKSASQDGVVAHG